jgi:serine/threonine protein kinase
MSPEQFANKRLDCRSDIYALGITLFELLTGELPFKGKSATEVAYKHLNDTVPVTKMVPKVPRNIRSLIKKMTAKNPVDRFQTPEELVTKIVEIRKKMAVDQSMVSNVHTMSIKKHKYTDPTNKRQLGTGKIKTLVEYHDSAIGQKKDHDKNQFRIFISIFLVIIIIFLCALNSFSSRNSQSKDIIKTIKSYSSNIEVLDREADKRHILLVKLFTTLSEKVSDNTLASEKISNELTEIKKEFGARKKKISEIIKTTDKNFNSFFEETKQKALQKENDLISSYRQLLWNQILENGFYYKFNKIKAILAREKINGPSWNREWITKRDIELASVFSLLNSIQSSPIELVGSKLEIGTIVATSTSKNTFLIRDNSSEKPIKIAWYLLSASDLSSLTLPTWNEITPNKEAINNLKFLTTLRYTKEDESRKQIISNFITNFSDELKVMQDMGDDIEKKKARLFDRIKGMKIEGLVKEKFKVSEKKETTIEQ